MFVLAFLLIAPVNKEADIKTKAEYIITLTWDDKSRDDVDIWLEDPTGGVLFFRDKEVGLMHLDRDDRGGLNDTITLGNGQVIMLEKNQEIVSIRGFIPGEWILNIHMYSKKAFTDITDVQVQMDKLNPKVETVLLKKYKISENWKEITVTRFTMAADGTINGWDTLPKEIVNTDREESPSLNHNLRGNRNRDTTWDNVP
jgi:hypothetical protein